MIIISILLTMFFLMFRFKILRRLYMYIEKRSSILIVAIAILIIDQIFIFVSVLFTMHYKELSKYIMSFSIPVFLLFLFMGIDFVYISNSRKNNTNSSLIRK